MSDRERIIIKALLEMLKRIGQCDEGVLQPALAQMGIPRLLVSEVKEAVEFCERERWINGIKGPFGNDKWSISDLGRAAVLEM